LPLSQKHINDWAIEGLTNIKRQSVIGQGKYPGLVKPHETIAEVMGGRKPKLIFDIHSISDVNPQEVDLAEIPRTGNKLRLLITTPMLMEKI
jgi:NADH-quinone oxidoreductase subunit G